MVEERSLKEKIFLFQISVHILRRFGRLHLTVLVLMMSYVLDQKIKITHYSFFI